MNISISIAKTVTDANQCDALLQQMLQSEYKFDNLINPDFKVENFFQKSINNQSQILLIAKDGEKIIGFLNGYIKQMPMQIFKEGILQLNILFVDEQYRNLKVGSRLVDHFTKMGKENGFNIIEVLSSINNTVAQRFYEKNNFNPINYELRREL